MKHTNTSGKKNLQEQKLTSRIEGVTLLRTFYVTGLKDLLETKKKAKKEGLGAQGENKLHIFSFQFMELHLLVF